MQRFWWVVVVAVTLASCGRTATATPWEQFGHQHNNDTLDNVISDWVAFQTAYNSAYDSHQTCDQAYEAAREAHDGYRRVEWDDELSDRPGTEYDQHVGRLLASELWLRQRGCLDAFDFASVG